jgi:hydroxyethylthiazole kinase-like uncharacterized protein yjeF
MERAGRAAAGIAMQLLGTSEGRVLVLCGPGNNGGDGLVMATALKADGREVVVAGPADPLRMPEDARKAREAWLATGGRIVEEFPPEPWALVVDALFGIGLGRCVEGRYAEWIARINAMNCPVLSLDIPSGLDSGSGAVWGEAVRATHTATFIALKPGLLTLDGPDHCGQVSVHHLDLPVPESVNRLVTTALFHRYLRPRWRNVHKGCFGALGVIGGASGMLGAALLASRAGLQLGAGKVFMGALDAGAPNVDPLHPEIMVRPPEDVLSQATVLALGPGLGQSKFAVRLLHEAIGFAGPLALDADGLNLLADAPPLQSLVARRTAATIVTPHPAEAARLLRRSVADVQADRLASAVQLSRRLNAVTLLKGCGSFVAAPDGRWFINTTGHGGMASAGMGDVLTGLIGALLAQGWPALEATFAAVHLHGAAAGCLAQSGVGPVGLTASETIGAARQLFNAWLHQGG